MQVCLGIHMVLACVRGNGGGEHWGLLVVRDELHGHRAVGPKGALRQHWQTAYLASAVHVALYAT